MALDRQTKALREVGGLALAVPLAVIGLGGASDPLAVAGLFGLGVVLGALAWWTGRLAPALTAHIGFNVAATISALDFAVIPHGAEPQL